MRIKDDGFMPCPICGKKPYVRIYEVSRTKTSSYAFCKGPITKRHKLIDAYVSFSEQYCFIANMRYEWNKEVMNTGNI
jgi:hypothetical protein